LPLCVKTIAKADKRLVTLGVVTRLEAWWHWLFLEGSSEKKSEEEEKNV